MQRPNASGSRGNSSKPGSRILDRPLARPAPEVSHSAFAFLFSELVQYYQLRINNVSELETKLEGAGFNVGWRVLDTIVSRERPQRRETKIVNMLQFVTTSCWRTLFGKPADALERSTESEDAYLIHERSPITNKFISVPKDLGRLNCAAFIAGVIHGLLDASGFSCKVTAHLVDAAGGGTKTIYLLKFDPEVLQREKLLA